MKKILLKKDNFNDVNQCLYIICYIHTNLIYVAGKMTRKSRIEPRKNLSFLSENDFWPKILPNAKNRQISQTGKAESFWETFVEVRLFPLLKFEY